MKSVFVVVAEDITDNSTWIISAHTSHRGAKAAIKAAYEKAQGHGGGVDFNIEETLLNPK